MADLGTVIDDTTVVTTPWVQNVNNAIYRSVVTSIAALRLLAVPTSDGVYTVTALGYTTAGDGGGGPFFYDAASVLADNGGSVIQPAVGPGRWRWTDGAIFNTRRFGVTTDALQFGTDAQANVLEDTLGLGGRRLSLQPVGLTGTAALQIIPGPNNDPATSVPSQLLLYNQIGNDYERFAFSCVNNQFVIDSTYNGAGIPRNIYFEMGGSVSNAIPGQNAVTIYSDASVDLNGASYTLAGKSWGSLRTRIADQANTGSTRLIIDTRTGTPSSNVADSSTVEYRRGGVSKWLVGLNAAGNNTDSFEFNTPDGVQRVRLLDVDPADGSLGLILRGTLAATGVSRQLLVGAADSAGAGFRTVMVAN